MEHGTAGLWKNRQQRAADDRRAWVWLVKTQREERAGFWEELQYHLTQAEAFAERIRRGKGKDGRPYAARTLRNLRRSQRGHEGAYDDLLDYAPDTFYTPTYREWRRVVPLYRRWLRLRELEARDAAKAARGGLDEEAAGSLRDAIEENGRLLQDVVRGFGNAVRDLAEHADGEAWLRRQLGGLDVKE